MSSCGTPCDVLSPEHRAYHDARLHQGAGEPRYRAYLEAYPDSSMKAATSGASRLERRPDVRLAWAHHQDEARKTGGAPTLLTEEVHAQIVGLVRLGHRRSSAAAAVGIKPDTFAHWLTKGRNGGPEKYLQFVQDLEGAEKRGQFRFENTVFKEAMGDGPPKVRKKWERGGPDGDMVLVEEVKETRPPNGSLLLELMARRFRAWPKVQRVEIASAVDLEIISALTEKGDLTALERIQAGNPPQQVWAERIVAPALPEGEV